MLYTVIKTGGKQYKVVVGSVIEVEKLEGIHGDKVSLQSLMIANKETPECTFGTGEVIGEIISQKRGKKIIIFKKKRRQGYRRKNGHRQDITVLRIKEIRA